MKGKVHFHATKKKAVSIIFKCNIRLYFLQKPKQTNTNKTEAKYYIDLFLQKYFNT